MTIDLDCHDHDGNDDLMVTGLHQNIGPTLVPDLRDLGCVGVSQVAFPPAETEDIT